MGVNNPGTSRPRRGAGSRGGRIRGALGGDAPPNPGAGHPYIPKNPALLYVPHNPIEDNDPHPYETIRCLDKDIGVWKNPETGKVTWVQVMGVNIVPDQKKFKEKNNYMIISKWLHKYSISIILYISEDHKLLGAHIPPDPGMYKCGIRFLVYPE